MKIGIKIGRFLNRYIKSYGVDWYYNPPIVIWPRRTIVTFICSIIAQIDEETYQKGRGTRIWQK